jgi:uncharacterized FlaG/YvyC family protein
MQINALTFNSDFSQPINQKAEFSKEAKATESKTPPIEKKADRTEDLTKLKTALAEHDLTLKFSQDAETNQLVVELIDEKTGEAIRQMPSEVSLKLAADFVKMQGQFVDETD